MLQKSKLLPVVLLVGMFSTSCAMPTTTKKTETVDVSDIDRAFSPSSFKISLSTTKKELAQQETLYENYVIKASNNSSLKSKLDNIKNMITKTKNDIVGYEKNLSSDKSRSSEQLQVNVGRNKALSSLKDIMTEIKNELASYEKSLNSSSSNVSSSSNNSNSDQKALVDQLTKEIETLKYSKTSNENLLNPRSDSRTINEANASLERIKVKMAELELRLADAKSKCGQTCVDAAANAVIDGYKKDYATLKNDLATANNNINSNQKKFDDIKTEYFKKQVDPKTKEAKWSPNQVDMFMAPSREAEKQLAIWKDKKATIEKQMATIKEKCSVCS